MTVANNDLLVGPVTPANGVTLISIDFYFEAAADLEVYKSGSNTPLVLNTDYTVSLPTSVGATDGSISLVVAANGTDRYSVYLKQPLQRSSDLQFRGDFRSPVINVELDRLWRAVQGINTALDRVFRFSQTSDVPDPLDAETAATRADKIIGFSADGTGLALIITPSALNTLAGLTDEIAVIGSLETELAALGALTTEIATVAGDSANISTLAAIAADITTLANANGGTLAGIWLFSSTAYLGIPRGTTAQRGSPGAGISAFRYNTTLGVFEGWDGSAWGQIGGGAGLFKGENGEVGSSAGDIFRINEQTLNTNVTIDADENASCAGPLTVASGVTLTVTSGGNLSIV